MKVKTADLVDAALDWAVAECLEATRIQLYEYNGRRMIRVSLPEGIHAPWEPSRYWGQGGPIIDRVGIQWAQVGGAMEAWSGFDYLEWRRNWELPPQLPQGAGFGTGPTVLSATMRCFVASQLGDEVEVPDELMK